MNGRAALKLHSRRRETVAGVESSAGRFAALGGRLLRGRGFGSCGVQAGVKRRWCSNQAGNETELSSSSGQMRGRSCEGEGRPMAVDRATAANGTDASVKMPRRRSIGAGPHMQESKGMGL